MNLWENYKKVLQLNPNFPDAYNNIGTIYSMLGKFNDAKKYFSFKYSFYFSRS